MPRVRKINCAMKDYPQFGIKKGDTHYIWQLYKRPLQRSKTYPKPWQLTGSPFLQSIYQIQDRGFSAENREALNEEAENLKGELEELRDECQDSYDNMPEQLQENSESGQLLQERIEALEEWIDNLDNVDVFDEELSSDEVIEELSSCDPGAIK